MPGHPLDFFGHLFFCGFNAFRFGDLFQQQAQPYLALGPFALLVSDFLPVNLRGAGINALAQQGAGAAFDPRVHLLLHQHAGNREVMLGNERIQHVLLGDLLFHLRMVLFDVFLEFGLEFLQGFEVACQLGQFIIELGQFLAPDC